MSEERIGCPHCLLVFPFDRRHLLNPPGFTYAATDKTYTRIHLTCPGCSKRMTGTIQTAALGVGK